MKLWLAIVTAALIHGPLTLAQDIVFSGVISFERLGSSINLSAARIENHRAAGTLSGTLALQLWATELPVANGQISGYKVAEVALGRMNGNFFASNISVNTTFHQPPALDSYNVVMTIAEWNGFAFATQDWRNFNRREVFDATSLPVINSRPLAVGTLGQDFLHIVSAINSPHSFVAESLPPGLSIHPILGSITGTPTTVGTFDIIVLAGNSSGTDIDVLTIIITGIPGTPQIEYIRQADSVRLSWPIPAADHVLESSSDLIEWEPHSSQPGNNSSENQITVSFTSSGRRFFRLRKL